MEWLINNWSVILGMVAVLITIVATIIWFIKIGRDKQLDKIKEWLLYACAIAEKELGNGTGQLKLRYVYDMFVSKFGWMKLIISFEQFSKLVDNSLDNLREMLQHNKDVQQLIQR